MGSENGRGGGYWRENGGERGLRYDEVELLRAGEVTHAGMGDVGGLVSGDHIVPDAHPHSTSTQAFRLSPFSSSALLLLLLRSSSCSLLLQISCRLLCTAATAEEIEEERAEELFRADADVEEAGSWVGPGQSWSHSGDLGPWRPNRLCGLV